MNKKELIKEIAERMGKTIKEVEVFFNAQNEAIMDIVAQGKKIRINGFGTFEPRERAARVGRNPRTGDEINIPASISPAFKAGKEFKQRVNK